MINVVCVQWGNKYSDDYIIKLYNSINRNTAIPFNFYVLSERNREVPGIIIPLLPGLDSWYNKLQLFILDAAVEFDMTFFFDLDTIIVKNIDNILSYTGKLIVLRDFYRKDGLGSGLMAWKTNQYSYIYKYYTTLKKKVHHLGDQGIVEDATGKDVNRWQDLFPEEIISYKVHCKQGLPETAKIVCFHGKPRPHMTSNDWIKEHWQ